MQTEWTLRQATSSLLLARSTSEVNRPTPTTSLAASSLPLSQKELMVVMVEMVVMVVMVAKVTSMRLLKAAMGMMQLASALL